MRDPGMGARAQRIDENQRRTPGRANGSFARLFGDARVQRQYWLELLTEAIDAWLRSAAFLECMQYGLHAATAVRRWQVLGPSRRGRSAHLDGESRDGCRPSFE
jgi:hypothetical protein